MRKSREVMLSERLELFSDKQISGGRNHAFLFGTS